MTYSVLTANEISINLYICYTELNSDFLEHFLEIFDNFDMSPFMDLKGPKNDVKFSILHHQQ